MTGLEILKMALKEDAPQGDITTQSIKIGHKRALGYFIAKENLVLSGVEFLQSVSELNLDIEIELFFNDGHQVLKGQKIAQLYGDWGNLVLVERTLLNLVGRFSGIATLTRSFVEEVRHTNCKILDTRKTMPLFRNLDKKAVVHGGGSNHRLNLSDQMMFKENHISQFEGNLLTTLIHARKFYPKVKITVECQDLEQLKELINCPIDQILLDNMNNDELRQALELIPKNIKSEASGNMTLDRVRSVAETGVDFISVGALTHSAKVADISFLL